MTHHEFGAKFVKSNIRNDDICNELILSRDDLRFDERERDKALKAKQQSSVLAEAEAVLAQTDEYFKARKQALIERHIQGRESLQDIDNIKYKPLNSNEPSALNYLDEHDDKLQAQIKVDS